MIRTVLTLTLTPKPGESGAVVELFERERIVEMALAVDGCHDVELWVRDGEILVMATWRDSVADQV